MNRGALRSQMLYRGESVVDCIHDKPQALQGMNAENRLSILFTKGDIGPCAVSVEEDPGLSDFANDKITIGEFETHRSEGSNTDGAQQGGGDSGVCCAGIYHSAELTPLPFKVCRDLKLRIEMAHKTLHFPTCF